MGIIRNKNDLEFFLAADKFALGMNKTKPSINDDVWKFQILLRKVEYHKNVKGGLLNTLQLRFYQVRKHKLGLKLGFDIPTNVFGAGLRINHFGNIVVSKEAKIGQWCDIHQGVNIGSNNSVSGRDLGPVVGHNVWIGPGAKLFGDINIGNEVQVAANAVVNKDSRNNTTVGGIPAKELSETGTESVDTAASIARVHKFVEQYPKYRRYVHLQ